MSEKKYSFNFTENEIMLLISALSCSEIAIEKNLKQKETAEKLRRSLIGRIDRIYGISKGD